MRKILLCLAGICLFFACQDIPEGFLYVGDAGYDPDSLVVKIKLDTASVMVPNPEWDRYYNAWVNLKAYGYPTIESWVAFLHGAGIYEEIESKGPDTDRGRYDIPWVSTQIQGVEGTNPIYVTITRVTTDTGNVDKLLEYITVRSDGTFTVPCRHDIPIGRYKISLNFRGPGHEVDFEDIFTVIVK